MKPRLLDLFCGAGGAAMGYHRAGFEVFGVDNKRQPNYPFPMTIWNAIDYVRTEGHKFDLIHASPPCQRYSVTSSLHDNEHPDLYEKVREVLLDLGVPWVIENVVGAPYRSGIILCGSMFGLPVWRHRNFETTALIMQPSCRHDLVPEPLDVTGTGGPGGRHRKPSSLKEAGEALGIDWMTRKELSQAIPPAYTEYIGRQLLEWPQAFWDAEVIA